MAEQGTPMTLDPNLWSESTEIVIGQSPSQPTASPIEAAAPAQHSVGDVVNGRPLAGVRRVSGATFISFDGNTWLPA